MKLKNYEITEIFDIKEIENINGTIVHDLTIKDDHSYTVNDYIVHNCTTSSNVSIHYPMASLIKECYDIKYRIEHPNIFKRILFFFKLEKKIKPTKIIADGGFKNFSDIIKALAIGADGVMIGGLFSKCIESCSDNFIKNSDNEFIKISNKKALNAYQNGESIYKYYRGMSTKEVQKTWNKNKLKTGEGITKYNLVEYTLKGWCENFTDYLKSAMSYTGNKNLKDFKEKSQFIKISKMSFERFNK